MEQCISMRRRICVLVLSAWRNIVIFGGHVFSRGMDMLYLVLIFSSFLGGHGGVSTTTIVRLFSGGMVLLPAVSINTLR